MSEQMDALRAMSPRSRTLALTQLGVEKEDWEELLAMGEAAKMEETSGGDLAARIERWMAVSKIVNGYSTSVTEFRGHIDPAAQRILLEDKF